MKIGSSNTPLNPGCAPRLVTRNGANTTQPGAPVSQDPVSLSELSRKLTDMESQLGSASVDGARVSAIKTAIRNGEFKVNAEVVADHLLQNVQDMLSGKA